MNDERKTKAQLAEELAKLRLQVADLRQREARASEAEVALRESEQFLQAILDGVEDGITVRDRDFNILRVNRWVEQLVAHEMPLVGKKCYRALEQREEPCPWCPAIKTMETGNVFSQVVSVPVAGGMTRWFELTAFPLRDIQGAIVGAIEHAKDVTERKVAEDALRKASEETSLILSSVSEEVIYHDRSMGIVWANRAASESAGLTPEQLVGRLCYEVWHGRKQPCDGCPVRKAMDTGSPAESEITTPDGRAWHVHGYPVSGDGGKVLGAVEVVRDITERKRAEEALRRSEANYRAIFNAANDFIVVHDMETGAIVDANQRLCETFGYTLDELRGKSAAFLSSGSGPYTKQDAARLRARLLAGEEPVVSEWLGKTRDGRELWVEVALRRAAIGGKDRALAVVRDISERKAAEEALRHSEANYRAIFNAAGDVLFVHDIETGDVVDFNQKVVEVYGYDIEEIDLLNEQFRRGADPPYSHEDEMRWLRRAADQGPQLFEWLATDRGGRRFWVEVSLRRASIGGHDRLLAVLRNIENRKHAEEALRRSEENYRALFEKSLDGITVVADGRLVSANQAFADIRARPLEQLLGKEVAELVHPDDRDAVAQSMQSVLVGKADVARDRRYRVQRADGTEALVEVLSNRIDWEGRPAIQSIFRDVTQQARLEEELRQAQKMEAVGQLAGGIAHDFNNLMTGILCHADLLRSESPSPEDVREAADLIEGAARRAAELTGQLLGFARRGKRRDVAVDLNAAARTSVRLLGRSLDPRIRVRMPFRDEHALVRGDPVQMEQVVLNLAVNARDAMPEGGEMTFTIHTLDVGAEDCKSRPGAEPGRYVLLSVADTGCGIPEAMRGRVFEPFFTTKPHGKGTGMGLAMVYGIVKDHGGWVEVDSEPGRGTTFRVFLPAAKAPADTGATPADADLRAPPDAGRILVVDDEELVRNVVVRMLSGLGYEVATAADAHEAVEYYRRFGRDVSVVIIDLAMPKMDGRRCFTALRGLDPDVKALLATGWGNEDRVQAALDEGMAGLVRKPFQTKQLAKAVKQALTR